MVGSIVDVFRLSDTRSVSEVISESRSDLMQQQMQQMKQASMLKTGLVTVQVPVTAVVPVVTPLVAPTTITTPVVDVGIFDMSPIVPNISLLGLPSDSKRHDKDHRKKVFDIMSIPLFKIHPVEFNRRILDVF